MKMLIKQILTAFIAAMIVIFAALAGAEGKPPTGNTVSAKSSDRSFAGMPNPIKEIKDEDEFEDDLGIEIDIDALKDLKPYMRIIGKDVGEVSFVLENVNAEPINWTFRFTKNGRLGKSPEAFSGVYDADMSKPVVTEVPLGDGKSVSIKYIMAKREKYHLYFWRIGDVYYSLSVNGDFSQMQFAAVMDRLMEVCKDD